MTPGVDWNHARALIRDSEAGEAQTAATIAQMERARACTFVALKEIESWRRRADITVQELKSWRAEPATVPARSDLPRISVVIATKNEARYLPWLFERMPPDLHEIILVDGFSRDNTVETAQKHWPDITIVEATRPGRGAALRAGFAATTGDIVVTLEADGSTDPAEIDTFVAALRSGADFVAGSRFVAGGRSAGMTPLQRASNWVLAKFVNALFRTDYSDIDYNYKAFWSGYLPHLQAGYYGDDVGALMNIRAGKYALRVTELPSFERDLGHSRLRNPLRHVLRVQWIAVHERLTRTSRPVDLAGIPAPLPAQSGPTLSKTSGKK